MNKGEPAKTQFQVRAIDGAKSFHHSETCLASISVASERDKANCFRLSTWRRLLFSDGAKQVKHCTWLYCARQRPRLAFVDLAPEIIRGSWLGTGANEGFITSAVLPYMQNLISGDYLLARFHQSQEYIPQRCRHPKRAEPVDSHQNRRLCHSPSGMNFPVASSAACIRI